MLASQANVVNLVNLFWSLELVFGFESNAGAKTYNSGNF